MRRILRMLMLAAVMTLSLCLCAEAETDWSHPYASVTSSPAITRLEERMLGRVLRVNEADGGWFGLTMPADGDLSLSVKTDNGFCMEIYVDDQFATSWTVGGGVFAQTLTLPGLKAGAYVTWWDRTADDWNTQMNPYMLLAGVSAAPGQAAAPAAPAAPTAAPTAAPAPTPTPTPRPTAVPEKVLSGDVAVGDTFFLGYYEQDGSMANGREPIEWTILSMSGGQNGTALVISSMALDCIQYHLSSQRIDWKNTSLRLWLNYYFLYQAFTPAEQACIEYTSNSSVVDMVTIPDENMVKKYKLAKTGCDVTEYAKSRGVQIGNDNGKGCWWVRMNTTASNGNTKFVGMHGKVYGSNNVTLTNNGVRPIMTVNLEALRSCLQDTSYQTRAIRSFAFAIDRIATRSGPATTFDEIHTFNVDYGTPVFLLRVQNTSGTQWVEIEFLYQGEWVRVWTGLKRVAYANLAGLPGDYTARGTGTVSSVTTGRYGPGREYKVLYQDIPAGLGCKVMDEDGSWLLIEYESSDPNHPLTHRCWVPADAIAR